MSLALDELNKLRWFTIGDGERFAVAVNRAIAHAIARDEPELAALMRLESDEEVDHIAAFGRVRAALQRRHGFGAVRMPVKPLSMPHTVDENRHMAPPPSTRTSRGSPASSTRRTPSCRSSTSASSTGRA